MTIFVHQSEFEEHEQKIMAGIHRAVEPDSLELEADLALIAVVGRGSVLLEELQEEFLQHWPMPTSTSK